MPFKSEAQRRLFYAKASRGEMPKSMVSEWEHATPKGKKLPEQVKKAEKPVGGLRPDVELYPHQQKAVDKLVKQDGNLLLSHGTGSGKTLTSIAGFEKLREAGKAERALVVTPASLRVNFADNGVRKFTDGRAAIFGNSQEVANGIARQVDNPDPGARYHVVGYEMYRKDPKKYIEAAGADTVIYDELHKIKNEEGVTSKTVKDARPYHSNFIGLTGSIMSNTPADLVPLVDAMTNGTHRLGNKTMFERRFVKEDAKGNKTITNPRMVRGLLAPFVDHFETKDLNKENVPKKRIEEVKVMMSPHQTDLYRYTIDQLDPVTALKFRLGKGKLKERELNAMFAKIIQSRQVSNSIHTIDRTVTPEQSAEQTPKVKQLLDDVQEHLGETTDGQAVVFSNLIHGGVDVLTAGLKARGVDHVTFIGKGNKGVTEESRQKAVQDFNSGGKKVIVISGAGGEGLDLKNATMFASLDGHFNPEKIQQAEARAVRAGGLAHRDPEERKVLIRRYVSVVPRSFTRTALDVANLLSPTALVNRIADPGAPILFNPFKREQSPDEWVYGVAERKDKLNAAFRDQLKTSSAEPHFVTTDEVAKDLEKVALNLVKHLAFQDELEKVAGVQDIAHQPYKYNKSDSHIMGAYWKDFGGNIEEMTDPAKEELPSEKDQLKEQKYIDNLRSYYREAAKNKGGVTKAPVPDRKTLLDAAQVSLISGGIMSAPTTATVVFDPMVPPKIKAIFAGGGLALGSALIAAPTLYAVTHNPTFTTPKAKASKMSRFDDEQLRQLLRGLPITQEVVKRQDFYI